MPVAMRIDLLSGDGRLVLGGLGETGFSLPVAMRID
jgi:hypothetical protein